MLLWVRKKYISILTYKPKCNKHFKYLFLKISYFLKIKFSTSLILRQHDKGIIISCGWDVGKLLLANKLDSIQCTLGIFLASMGLPLGKILTWGWQHLLYQRAVWCWAAPDSGCWEHPEILCVLHWWSQPDLLEMSRSSYCKRIISVIFLITFNVRENTLFV